MFRDGARKSIWQEEIKRFSSFPPHQRHFDVAIVGGGITGVSTAYRLQLEGKRCILLDANNIGFGTTGGTTAHINDFFDTSYDEVIRKFGLQNAHLLHTAGKEAIQVIEENIAQHQIDCDFQRRDAQLFALNEQQEQILADMVEGSQKVGHQMTYISNISYPIPFQKAVAIPNQAQFHPIKYIKALADIFVQNGGVIVEDCLCRAHEERDDQVLLQTSQGDLRVGQLVYATHTPPGVNLLHFTTAPYRSYAIAFSLKGQQYPEELGYDLAEPYHYYRTQIIDDRTLLIGGGEDHKTGHTEDTGACFARLENYCRTHFDVDTVEYSWSSQYFEPADGMPSIGKLPGSSSRIYVATGFRGNGMPFGSLSSAILTDLIVRGESRYENLFNPSRFKPAAGFTNFVKENATVVHDMVADKLSIERIKSLSDIPTGEARVVKLEGASYAVYREQDGRVHLLKSTCPHAKCEVRWNKAELSWDCPCHGSRFNINGRLLNAPATIELQRFDTDDLR